MKFTLQPEDKVELEKLAKSGMTPVIISQRAKILLKKAENKSSTVVAGEIGVNRGCAKEFVQYRICPRLKPAKQIRQKRFCVSSWSGLS